MSSSFQEKGFTIENCNNGILIVKLNRPHKKNALKLATYGHLGEVLRLVATDSSIKIVAVTGEGDYYSSGNDLSNFLEAEGDMDSAVEAGAKVFEDFVKALIVFPKVLVSLVNGPAVGIMVTTLPLFDVVYASDKATFTTPFSKLGQSLEGASSYTFPRTMQRGAAMEMLCFDQKIDAEEAKQRGLVTNVFPHTDFKAECMRRLNLFATKPASTLEATKRLIRQREIEQMLKANTAEVETLRTLWKSEECLQSVMKFFMERKSNSKL